MCLAAWADFASKTAPPWFWRRVSGRHCGSILCSSTTLPPQPCTGNILLFELTDLTSCMCQGGIFRCGFNFFFNDDVLFFCYPKSFLNVIN